MKVIFDDVLQRSDAPSSLISPSLADRYSLESTFAITLDESAPITAIGVGNTDATEITINSEVVTLASTETNGLYQLTTELSTDTLNISHDGTYLGRLAAGTAHAIYAAPSHEPGFWSTASPRTTASGQIIAGAGGVTGRRISLDFRYKFTEAIIEDIERAYADQIGAGFPLFLWFDKESRMPWTRMYATTDPEMLFQSSINRYLYSRRFEFREAF